VAEAMAALKIPPREQKQIANALKQRELAEFSRFDPRVAIDPAVKAGPNPVNVVAGVSDPKRGGDRLQIARDVQYQQKVIGQGIDGEAAKPFIGLQVGEKRGIQNNRQVFRGNDPTQVREALEERNRSNREKKVLAASKKGKKLGPVGVAEERQEAGRIRDIQEGNVFTKMRADRAAAQIEARPQNSQGRFSVGADLGSDIYSGAGQQGRAFAPRPKVKLQPRPVRPQENRTVVDAGDGFRNVQVPEGFTPQAPQASPSSTRDEVSRRLKGEITSSALRKQRNLRRGVSGGLGAAALAGILGLSGDDEEDRQEQY